MLSGPHRVLTIAAAVTIAVVCAAIMSQANGDDTVPPMNEARLAGEVLGNEAAASCTVDRLDEANIPLDVLESIVAVRTPDAERDRVLGPSELETLDAAQAIMWSCMIPPSDGESADAAVPSDGVDALPSSLGSSEDAAGQPTGPVVGPDTEIVRVDGQPPVYNRTPIWAPAPGTVTTMPDGAAVIAEQPVAVIVPFDRLPERATNRT